MNKCTFNILKKLINNNGKPLIIKDLIDKYDISSRTFYNYVHDINYYLQTSSISGGVLIENDCLKADLDSVTFTYITNHISNQMNSMSFEEYKLSNDERRNLIILILLSNNGAVKKQYFEDVLLVSRTSIINDFHYVKSFFSKHKITFKENTHQGLEIVCDEKSRRLATIDLLLNQVFIDFETGLNPIDPYTTFVIDYLRLDKTILVSESAIKKCEEETNTTLSDFDYYRLSMVLSYIISRLKSRNQLVRNTIESNKDGAFIFAEHVFSNIEKIVDSNYTEISFFTEIINNYKLLSYSFDKEANGDDYFVPLVVKDFLETLSFYFKTNFIEDENLIGFLNAHINCYRRRVLDGEAFNNPFLSQIISRYKDYFEIIKENIYILENSLSISFDNDEIALLLMHVLASIERKNDSDYIPRVVVVCGSGNATSNYLAALIRSNFKVNIVSVSSLHNALTFIKKDHVDLVISTIPCSLPQINVVVVDPYLKDDDKKNIQNALNSITKNTTQVDFYNSVIIEDEISNYTKQIPNLETIIMPDLIKLDVNVSNWKEAIIASGELLLWEKCITVNYLQQMIQLVDKYGPYIVIADGVAFAHASPSQGSLRNGISIVRLNNPIEFGKDEFDPVKIVVGCSILESQENLNSLLQIMKLIKSPSFYKTVESAKDKDEILKLFMEGNTNNEEN